MPHFSYKDPDEEINYRIDFSNALDVGETIDTGNPDTTWTVPAGITKIAQSFTADGKAVVRIGGGSLRSKYDAYVTVRTSAGQKIVDSIQISIATRKSPA